MKKISEIFKVHIESEEYKNSPNFKIEKSFDHSRYIKMSLSAIDTLRSDYEHFRSITSKKINNAKLLVQNTIFKNKFEDFISSNILQVKVIIEKQLKNKTKKISFIDKKYSDYFLDFCDMYLDFDLFKDCLSTYKKNHLMKATSQDPKEIVDVNKTLQVTKLANTLLNQKPFNTQIHALCKKWAEFLENHVELTTSNIEYVGDYTRVDTFIPFSSQEANEVEEIYNNLYSLSQNDTLEFGM